MSCMSSEVFNCGCKYFNPSTFQSHLTHCFDPQHMFCVNSYSAVTISAWKIVLPPLYSLLTINFWYYSSACASDIIILLEEASKKEYLPLINCWYKIGHNFMRVSDYVIIPILTDAWKLALKLILLLVWVHH